MARKTPRRLGDVLELSRQAVTVDGDNTYTSIGIRSFGRGLFHYPPVLGAELSRLRYFRFPSGALAISNIKGWEGAVALTSVQDSECIASNRFLFYAPRNDEVDIEYLFFFFLTPVGVRLLGKSSPGSADRNRTLGIQAFENTVVSLPDISEQKRVSGMLREDLRLTRELEALLSQQQLVIDRIRRRALHAALELD